MESNFSTIWINPLFVVTVIIKTHKIKRKSSKSQTLLKYDKISTKQQRVVMVTLPLVTTTDAILLALTFRVKETGKIK